MQGATFQNDLKDRNEVKVSLEITYDFELLYNEMKSHLSDHNHKENKSQKFSPLLFRIKSSAHLNFLSENA